MPIPFVRESDSGQIEAFPLLQAETAAKRIVKVLNVNQGNEQAMNEYENLASDVSLQHVIIHNACQKYLDHPGIVLYFVFFFSCPKNHYVCPLASRTMLIV